LNDESITLLLREATDLSGVGLDIRDANPIAEEEEAAWVRYYTFGPEAELPAGTQVVIHAGRRADGAPEEHRLQRRYLEQVTGAADALRLPEDGVEVRLTGSAAHRQLLLPPQSADAAAFHVLRKADGAELALVTPDRSPWEPGLYHLSMAYRRDNRAVAPLSPVLEEAGLRGDELVTLTIPVYPR
jgi:hypothetical protein